MEKDNPQTVSNLAIGGKSLVPWQDPRREDVTGGSLWPDPGAGSRKVMDLNEIGALGCIGGVSAQN